jgi:hypothetical protein
VYNDSADFEMVAGLGVIVFHLHDCDSLKGKRKIVKSIITRLKNTFNASVAEVGDNDDRRRARIGVAFIGNDRKVINAKLDKLFNAAEGLGGAVVTDTQMEIISL